MRNADVDARRALTPAVRRAGEGAGIESTVERLKGLASDDPDRHVRAEARAALDGLGADGSSGS